jgi:hypothetical protein
VSDGIKISELPVITLPYLGSEQFPIVQSNETRVSTLSSLVTYLSGALLADSELSALSGNWQSTYTTMTANSGNWQNTYSTVNTLSSTWDKGYTAYNGLTALSGNWQNTYSTVNTLSADWTVELTGKTIYVDANTGSDTRNGFSKYDLFKPFATIGAAVAASSPGDLVYVRAGTYTISAQINLNLKGHLYFAPGTTVNIASGVVAFSYSQNSIPIYIRGAADFVLAGSAGVLTMPSGNAATAVAFECNTIYSLTTVSGTLFNCAIGALSVDAKVIQLTPASINATVFNITGTGKVTTRIPFVYCGIFLNGAGVYGAQINADIWTLTTYNTTAGIAISSITTNFRIVNYIHVGVGVAFNWTENTITEGHGFREITWSSNNTLPNIRFASSAGSTSNKLIRLNAGNILRYASTNSLSSNVPINVATYGTFASAPATSNVTFKIGSFTVDADVNAY